MYLHTPRKNKDTKILLETRELPGDTLDQQETWPSFTSIDSALYQDLRGLDLSCEGVISVNPQK